MYRSAWGTFSPGQEVVLGLRIARSFFDTLLATAVASSYNPGDPGTHEEWQERVRTRTSAPPDHSPSGGKLERRAIQLGLRDDVLHAFATSERSSGSKT